MSIESNATPFSSLQAMVLEVFKRTDKNAEIKRAISDTNREMVACIDPRRQKDQIYKTVTIGREELPIPMNLLRVNHPIRLLEPGSSSRGSSYPLDFISKAEYDEIESNPNAAIVDKGRPHAYTIYKNSVLLTDIPDKAYVIEINIGGEATELVEDSDQTIFSPTWDETIKAGALARAYAGIKYWEESERWQSIYRWGFAGRESNIVGGLELLQSLERQITKAPSIVEYRDF